MVISPVPVTDATAPNPESAVLLLKSVSVIDMGPVVIVNVPWFNDHWSLTVDPNTVIEPLVLTITAAPDPVSAVFLVKLEPNWIFITPLPTRIVPSIWLILSVNDVPTAVTVPEIIVRRFRFSWIYINVGFWVYIPWLVV